MTPKQAIFIAEYLADPNATRAAIAAGFSAAAARVTGARLLKNAKVRAALAQRTAQRVVNLDITADRTMAEAAKIAYYDAGRLFDKNGKMLPVSKLDEVTRAAVEAVEIDPDTGRIKKVTMAKKIPAITILAKFQKLLTDRVEHDGLVTLEQLVSGAESQAE
ncbi:MAG TPA: terminase small subunit [Terracidiphilus sp.]|nr:terminase small subunit [Terracidiphilus sp.]